MPGAAQWRHNGPVDSRPVQSDQRAPDERLDERVQRHLATPYARPIAQHTRDAVHWLREQLGDDRPLILDSGCGTGESSRYLAGQWPGHWVVGVDRSAHRLARSGWQAPGLVADNLVLLRANLVDLWRLLLEARMLPQRHYLLYPNPYPKPAHLGRRWHGHPVFPTLIALGGRLEMRTNWDIYALEFARAMELAAPAAVTLRQHQPDPPLTAFERKYLSSRHQLFQVVADLPSHYSSSR